LELSRNISKALVSHTVKNFKLLWPRSFNNSQKNSAQTGSTDLFSAGDVVLNERRTRWKLRYRNKVHSLSYIFVFFCIDTLSGYKDTNMDALLLGKPLKLLQHTPVFIPAKYIFLISKNIK